ncbi:hypothetical protein D3C80_1910340 [compost metagenome]
MLALAQGTEVDVRRFQPGFPVPLITRGVQQQVLAQVVRAVQRHRAVEQRPGADWRQLFVKEPQGRQ